MGEGRPLVGVLIFSVNNATVGCKVYGGKRLRRAGRCPARTFENNARVLGAVYHLSRRCLPFSTVNVDATKRIGPSRNSVVCTGDGVPSCANARFGGVLRGLFRIPITMRGSIGDTTLKRTIFNTKGKGGSFLYLACKANINNTVVRGGRICRNSSFSTKRFNTVVARTRRGLSNASPFSKYCRQCTSTATLMGVISAMSSSLAGNQRVFTDLGHPRVGRIVGG